MSDDATATFATLLEQAVGRGELVRLVLAKPRAAGADLRRVTARPLQLKGAPCLSLLHTHATRDVTTNLAPADGVAALRALIGTAFGHAHLFTATEEVQLLLNRRGHATLRRHAADHAPAAAAHDRAKHRFVALDRPYLAALGVTDAQHRLVPAMARKWKQINKFVEVADHALRESALRDAPALDVVDIGSGKGYLTFALHDHLRTTLGRAARVTGVELRADMVDLGNAAAARLGLEGLAFELGDVRRAEARPVDVLIALHACDTATDHAIHIGVRAGASIILCSPCCHKELRPQLLSPQPLRPLLRHGVHLGQQAEMLTDALRAMLLDACGYDAQVFEFVSLEHTSKNKMILAVKRATPPDPDVWRQIDDLKGFYGVREQCLESLLKADRARAAATA